LTTKASRKSSGKPQKSSSEAAREEHRRRRADRQRQQQIIFAVIGGIVVLVIVIAVVSALIPSKYKTTATGLKYQIIEQGTGAKPQIGDTVVVKYTGKLADGTVFDSTDQQGGEPLTFTLGIGQVIKGWDEGIALLNEGGKAVLVVPPDLGYGPQENGPIPANSTLTFEVELVAVNPPEATPGQ
jgi:hypothetical protein